MAKNSIIVRDAEIFKNIELHQLRDYLQSTGWHLDRPFLDNATIWLKQEPQRGEFEILLPNSQHLGDYVARICEAIEILATPRFHLGMRKKILNQTAFYRG